MVRDAILSDDGKYRYLLSRAWAAGHKVLFVMLNPSTADAKVDDPTIRKCVGFAQRWGFARVDVANLYALRSTDPLGLARVVDPVGPDADFHLRLALQTAAKVVFAWGVPPASLWRRMPSYATPVQERVKLVQGLATEPQCLGFTADGWPRHPVRLAYSTLLETWK